MNCLILTGEAAFCNRSESTQKPTTVQHKWNTRLSIPFNIHFFKNSTHFFFCNFNLNITILHPFFPLLPASHPPQSLGMDGTKWLEWNSLQ